MDTRIIIFARKINNFELGEDYPLPIVDHQKAREAALNAFQKIKKN